MTIRSTAWILALVPVLAACGALSGVAGRSTAAAVDQGLGELAEEEQRDDLARVLGDREIRAEVQRSTVEIVEAILDEAMSEERMQRIEGVLVRLSRAIGGNILDVESIAGDLLAQVRPALNELSHPESREGLALVTRAVVGTMATVLAESLREDIGPAMQQVIREDVAIGLERALDERLTESFGNTARVMAREAVIGAGEGMDQLDARRDVTVLDRVRGALAQGEDFAQALTFGLGLLVSLLIAGVVLAVVATRRARARAEEKHDALLLVMSTLKATDKQPWSRDLCNALKEGMRDERGGDVVRAVLRSRPDLRMCPGVEEQLDDREKEALDEVEERSGIHARPRDVEPGREETGTD